MVKVSLGPIISMIFYMMVYLVNSYFIGHTNDATLIAGIGIGNMVMNVSAFAIQQGINSALETFIGQSYGASQSITTSS